MNKYVSGIRPSGKLHLGNYLGAIKQWKTLQESGESCFFFVADMHGQYTTEEILKTQYDLTQFGISNTRQSNYHFQLLSLQHQLSFYANTSRLDNMTQYKEKGGTLALYAYPVLMAADILFHEATHVPIGADQKQHLEFVRELARKINRIEPEGIISSVGARIMGLKDPRKKMSKSGLNPDDCIYLCDSASDIARKIKGANTSTDMLDNSDATKNLRNIFCALGGNVGHTRWSDFKRDLTDLLIKELNAK